MAQTASVKKSSNVKKTSQTTTKKKTQTSKPVTKTTQKKPTPKVQTKKQPPISKEKHSIWEEYDFPVMRELIRWLLVAFSLILFLSSFTQEGNNLVWLKKVNFGLFGMAGYVSVFLTIYLAFYVLPELGRPKAMIRLISVLLVTASICGMLQILCKEPLSVETTIGTYYKMGYTQGGGVFGGIMVLLLYSWLGTVGMAILLIALIICGAVVMSERSGIAFVKHTTKSFYTNVKHDMEEYRAESGARAEERQKKKEIRERKQEEARIRATQETHKLEKKKQVIDEDEEAEWKRLEEEALRYADEQKAEESNVEDVYVKKEVEKIQKRVARKKELEEESKKPLMEWNDTTEDTEHNNPVDYTDMRDKYSNTAGNEDARLAVAGTRTVVTASGKVITVESDEIPPAKKKRKIPAKANEDEQKEDVVTGTTEEYTQPKPYCFPTLDLLNLGDRKSNGKSQEKELRETAEILEKTFRDFGVGVTVTNYSCGPTVTRYELEPDHGVKVSRITALTDDIKLKLAATDLRIEAPIPGKAAVGIEVPNRENSTVMFRDLIESEAFQRHPSKLAFAVGKDIGGKTIVFDIAKMPHVLIAGATGSGKSVCINTLIMSILYKAEPSEVKLIMVDPKVVELSVYNNIPHLLIPVVTDPKKAAGALNWAVAEMTRRYQMFADTATRDLAGYNKKAKGIRAELEKEGLTPDKIQQEGPEVLPQIVIIVDELADLMMVAPNEVEEAICRLAQLARAAGIHLVLATQRPSVNVITGLIKANVPSRIAFSVSSGVDSRTILDMNGAEKLLGKGDMLFAPFGSNKPVRVQGAFISDAEVLAVTNFIKQENEQMQTQQKEIKLDLSIEHGTADKESGSDRDEYFEQAGYFLIEKEKGSIGMLQRMFKIGFNRAARIMEQLAEAGVVGPEEGTKPRKVLMTNEEFKEFLENN